MNTSNPTNAHALAMQRALNYPDGGYADAKHGQLRCDGTQAGRLARLEDVARYVMARYELPPVEATAWLCDSLEAVSPALYLLSESGRAAELPPAHSFAWVPFSWDPQPAAAPADCALAGAVKHMRLYWDTADLGSAGAIGESCLDPLAIRLDDAFALWGFGTREPAHVAAGDVQPLAGWQQNTSYGFMGFDSSPAGRLVRLVDVVRWFEAAKALPRSKAIDALCDGLDAGALGALYQVRPGAYAERMPANHAYGYRTVSQLQAAHARAKAADAATARAASWQAVTGGGYSATGNPVGGVSRSGTPTRIQTPVAPGLPALVLRIRETWLPGASKSGVDVLDDARHADLTNLAICFDVAYALWGWGSVTGEQAGEPLQSQDKDFELLALLEAYETRGNTTLKQFAQRHGLKSDNAKKRLIAARKKRKASISNPFAALSVVGGKKVAKK